MKTCPDAYHCPVEATIDIVGGKHKVLILWHLSKHGVCLLYTSRARRPACLQACGTGRPAFSRPSVSVPP